MKQSSIARKLSQRADRIPRSAIREIMAMAAGRDDVIHLEVGEPDFITPSHIMERSFDAVRGGATRYTGNAGLPSLRAAIAARVTNRSGVDVAPGQVVVTVGAIGALYASLMAVLDPGDEVLIPDPGWPNYEAIAVLAGASAVRYKLHPDRGFAPDPDEIASLIGPRTKAIVVNSPGNPTGSVFPADVVAAIGRIASRTGVFIISDEVYEDIVFDGARHVSFAEHTPADRLFLVSGASKSYAMTGWRLGWVVCPADAVSIAEKLQEPVVSCAPTPSQVAAEAALTGPQDEVAKGCALFQRRRDIFVEEIGSTGRMAAVPRGAFYGLVDIGQARDTAGGGVLGFAKRLLVEHGVAVVPGDTFGPSTAGMVRVAFTIEDERLRDGLKRLASALK